MYIGVDAQNSNIVYAGSQYGGVYKSSDGGANWTLSTSGINNLTSVFALAVDPSTSGTVYISARIDDGVNPTAFKVFKSTNGGVNWTPSSNGFPFDAHSLTIDSTTPTTLYAATFAGVYKSTDGGVTWTERDSGIAASYINAVAVSPSNSAILYVAGSDSGANLAVYKSIDAGATWSVTTSVSDGSFGGIAIDPTNANVVYVGSSAGVGGFPNSDRVFKSADGGATWTDSSTGLGNDREWGTKFVVHHPVISGKVFTNKMKTGDLYVTTNGATSWSSSSAGIGSAYVGALAFAPSNLNVVYAGTARGVFRSTDGGTTWTAAANTSLRNTSVSALAFDPTNSAVLYAGITTPFTLTGALINEIRGAGSPGVLKSTDGGSTWTTLGSGLPSSAVVSIVVDPQTPATLYVALSGNGIYKSVNAGATWTAANSGIVGALETEKLVMSPQDPQILYTYTGYTADLPHFYKSTDGGANWTVSETGMTDRVQTFAIDPRSPNILYAVTRPDGPVAIKLFKSVDSAASWTDITNSLSTPFLYDVAPDPFNAGTVYGASITGFLKSIDGGATWSASGNGLSGTPSSITFDPTTPNTIYVATGGGRFKSVDGGANWTALDSTIRQASRMLVNPQDPAMLYVGTVGNGVNHLRQVPPQPGVLQLSANAYSIGEGVGSVAIVIKRTGGSDGAASVQIATSNGTATAGSDYTATTQTVTWNAGDAADKTISIPITADSVDEPDETFSVALSAATGASLGSPAAATVTSVDDDPTPTTPATPAPNSEGKLSGGGAVDFYLLLSMLLFAVLRMRYRVSALIVPAAAMLIVAQAHAADLYVGARVAASDSNIDSGELSAKLQARGSNVTASLDDTDAAESVFGGLWFSPHIGAEFGYERLGEYRSTISGNLSDPEKVVKDASKLLPPTGNAASVAARFRIPFGQSRVSFMPRVGAAYWDGEIKLDIAGARKKANMSGWALLAGATVDFAFTSSLHAGVGIDTFRRDRGLVQQQWSFELSWWR